MRHTRRRSGFLVLEAVLGLSMLIVTFMLMFIFWGRLWIQVRTENAAETIVRAATREDREPGETQAFQIFDNRADVTVEWSDEYVEVQIDVLAGMITAGRTLPREVL